MESPRRIFTFSFSFTPLRAALLVVGLTVGGLLLGYAPIGADPDLLYRPIKEELARALRTGGLPFWSDRFGLGVPLVAESHAAALYPPNWLLYRLLKVNTAYRLAMWLHYLALVFTTYAYARILQIGPWGAALAAATFSLCGFQAIHAGHEPFYHVLPFLPLCLLLADRYVVSGRLLWLALVALAWGGQLTLGHFQIQAWTGG
ncbi:MAG: YfhO family protein, partial [Isosphaeraceae bacterium]|nr:YfhO family protein [Isosphaeraceae bacterium]